MGKSGGEWTLRNVTCNARMRASASLFSHFCERFSECQLCSHLKWNLLGPLHDFVEFLLVVCVRGGAQWKHTATLCNTLRYVTHGSANFASHTLQRTSTHCHTLQHTATHCNTLQNVTHGSTLLAFHMLQHTATH